MASLPQKPDSSTPTTPSRKPSWLLSSSTLPAFLKCRSCIPICGHYPRQLLVRFTPMLELDLEEPAGAPLESTKQMANRSAHSPLSDACIFEATNTQLERQYYHLSSLSRGPPYTCTRGTTTRPTIPTPAGYISSIAGRAL